MSSINSQTTSPTATPAHAEPETTIEIRTEQLRALIANAKAKADTERKVSSESSITSSTEVFPTKDELEATSYFDSVTIKDTSVDNSEADQENSAGDVTENSQQNDDALSDANADIDSDSENENWEVISNPNDWQVVETEDVLKTRKAMIKEKRKAMGWTEITERHLTGYKEFVGEE